MVNDDDDDDTDDDTMWWCPPPPVQNPSITTSSSTPLAWWSYPVHHRSSSYPTHLAFPPTISTFITRLLQWSLLVLVLPNLLFPSAIDTALSSFYHSVLLPSPLFHWPLLEAVVATISFFVFYFFYNIFNWMGLRRIDGSYGPVYKSEVLSWVVKNTMAYLGGIALLHCVVTKRPPVMEAIGFRRLLGEVAIGVLLYDLCFYPIHMLFHKGPFKWLREIHSWHHDGYQQAILTPISTVRQHYADGGIQVMVNIAVQNLAMGGTVITVGEEHDEMMHGKIRIDKPP